MKAIDVTCPTCGSCPTIKCAWIVHGRRVNGRYCYHVERIKRAQQKSVEEDRKPRGIIQFMKEKKNVI